MQPAVTSHLAPWSQQLTSPQVAQAPAGNTPVQLPAPPVPLEVVEVVPLLVVEEVSPVLVEVVDDPPDPPAPVGLVGLLLHAEVASAAATRMKAYVFIGYPPERGCAGERGMTKAKGRVQPVLDPPFFIAPRYARRDWLTSSRRRPPADP
jgi:hypothetical protein